MPRLGRRRGGNPGKKRCCCGARPRPALWRDRLPCLTRCGAQGVEELQRSLPPPRARAHSARRARAHLQADRPVALRGSRELRGGRRSHRHTHTHTHTRRARRRASPRRGARGKNRAPGAITSPTTSIEPRASPSPSPASISSLQACTNASSSASRYGAGEADAQRRGSGHQPRGAAPPPLPASDRGRGRASAPRKPPHLAAGVTVVETVALAAGRDAVPGRH